MAWDSGEEVGGPGHEDLWWVALPLRPLTRTRRLPRGRSPPSGKDRGCTGAANEMARRNNASSLHSHLGEPVTSIGRQSEMQLGARVQHGKEWIKQSRMYGTQRLGIRSNRKNKTNKNQNQKDTMRAKQARWAKTTAKGLLSTPGKQCSMGKAKVEPPVSALSCSHCSTPTFFASRASLEHTRLTYVMDTNWISARRSSPSAPKPETKKKSTAFKR